MRKLVDFWYCQISWSYVVGNVRYTVRIDVSYILGVAQVEVMTWSPTYSNCSWMISMQLFDPPCFWCCCPCSLCSQLLYRSFTASWLICCLNEGTIVLTMWAHQDYVMMNVSWCFSFSCVLGKSLNAWHVSIFSGPKWQLTIFHTAYIYSYPIYQLTNKIL
jgi:hypothetical protein